MDFTYYPNRIALLDGGGRAIAEITFPDIDEDTVDINHTFVDESLRGQGMAGKLMEAAVNQIQSQGKKAVPTCSYAVKWFEKHPEYNKLVKEPPGYSTSFLFSCPSVPFFLLFSKNRFFLYIQLPEPRLQLILIITGNMEIIQGFLNCDICLNGSQLL